MRWVLIYLTCVPGPPVKCEYIDTRGLPQFPSFRQCPVARDGRVYSVATNWRGYGRREMLSSLNDDGYPSVRILVNGKRKRIAIHVLVARAYLPPRPSPRHEVRHLDGDKFHCAADNLAWGTQKDNADDRERHGRTSRGAKHSAAVRASSHDEAVRDYFRSKREMKNV